MEMKCIAYVILSGLIQTLVYTSCKGLYLRQEKEKPTETKNKCEVPDPKKPNETEDESEVQALLVEFEAQDKVCFGFQNGGACLPVP